MATNPDSEAMEVHDKLIMQIIKLILTYNRTLKLKLQLKYWGGGVSLTPLNYQAFSVPSKL